MYLFAPHVCLVPREDQNRYMDTSELEYRLDIDIHRGSARN